MQLSYAQFINMIQENSCLAFPDLAENKQLTRKYLSKAQELFK